MLLSLQIGFNLPEVKTDLLKNWEILLLLLCAS